MDCHGDQPVTVAAAGAAILGIAILERPRLGLGLVREQDRAGPPYAIQRPDVTIGLFASR
jgi:hypothetical protein